MCNDNNGKNCNYCNLKWVVDQKPEKHYMAACDTSQPTPEQFTQGRVVCWMAFLHVGQMAIHMPTFLPISCTDKIDHIHGC